MVSEHSNSRVAGNSAGGQFLNTFDILLLLSKGARAHGRIQFLFGALHVLISPFSRQSGHVRLGSQLQ